MTHHLLKNQSDIDIIRDFTGVSNNVVTDDGISLYIGFAENYIFENIGMFKETSTTETLDGDGSIMAVLENTPVLSVSSIIIDDISVDSDGYYWYEDGKIILDDTEFTADYQNVGISYTYGLTEAKFPEKFHLAQDLARALTEKSVLLEAANKQSKGIDSEKYGDYSLGYAGMPYKGQLVTLEKQIEGILNILGTKIVYGVV